MTAPAHLSWTSVGRSRSLTIEPGDLTHASEARGIVQSLAAAAGFDEQSQGQAAIVATESATNLAKHSRGGELHLRLMDDEIEILSIDSGPGMEDVDRCLEDGYSTAGSQGTGLGAMKRLASSFDIHSVPGRGTAVLARIRKRSASSSPAVFVSGGVWRPAPGESMCGDAIAVTQAGAVAWVMAVDGLGHGLQAAEAAEVAVHSFLAGTESDAAARINRIHAALRATRGAALSVARVDGIATEVEYAGIGNIAGTVRREQNASGLVSLPGIAGHQVRKVQPFRYAWSGGATLVLHSDGLQSQWSMDGEPGLNQRHPSIIAAVLVRNFTRGRDDVSVVVLRQAGR